MEKKVCWQCGKERERCRAVSVHQSGEIEWACPQCWRDLDYDKYVRGSNEKDRVSSNS